MTISGRQRTFITIQSRTQTGVDALNAPVYAWSTFKTAWTDKETRSGTEQLDEKTGQRYSQTRHRFSARFFDVRGVTTEMQLVFDGQTYDIRSVLPDDQRRHDTVIEATLQDGSA